MEKISSFNSIRLKLNLLFKITYYILLIDQKFTKFNQNIVYKDLSNYALTSSIFNRLTKSSKNGRNYWITSTTKLDNHIEQTSARYVIQRYQIVSRGRIVANFTDTGITENRATPIDTETYEYTPSSSVKTISFLPTIRPIPKYNRNLVDR